MRPPEEVLTEEPVDSDVVLETEGDDVISDLTVGFVKKASVFLNSFIDILVGVCFIIMGLEMVLMTYQWGYSVRDYELLDWISLLDTIIGGTILILNPRRTFNSSIGIYAITMGLLSFCNNWATIGEGVFDDEDSLMALFSFIGDIEFIINLGMVILSLNLMVSGVSYLRGRPRGTIGMMNKAAFMLFISLFYILVEMAPGMGDYDNLIDLMVEEPSLVLQAIMFFIFLIIMDSDEARNYNTKNRLGHSTDAIRYSNTMDKRSYIELDDARALIDPKMGAWTELRDGGPVDREYHFPIQTADGASYVTVQRWRGSEKYYLTITDHERGTNIRATRMTAESFVLSEDYDHLDMKGADHFIIRIRVRMPLSELTVAKGVAE